VVIFGRGRRDYIRRDSRRGAKVLGYFVRQIEGAAGGTVFGVGDRFYRESQAKREGSADGSEADAAVCGRRLDYHRGAGSHRSADCRRCSDSFLHLPISFQQDRQRREPRATQYSLRTIDANFPARRARDAENRARTLELGGATSRRKGERITRCRGMRERRQGTAATALR
jgi:hypothetical protein